MSIERGGEVYGAELVFEGSKEGMIEAIRGNLPPRVAEEVVERIDFVGPALVEMMIRSGYTMYPRSGPSADRILPHVVPERASA